MLNDNDLSLWFIKNNIPKQTQDVINGIRQSDPSRRVRSGTKNVSGSYPSKKMGVTIQFESHRNELPRIKTYEDDEDVLEFYDQPPTFKLSFRLKNGRPFAVLHVCDYFVIRRTCAGWEECKMSDDLPMLHEKCPERYLQGTDGIWRCPPGEEYAAQFGLYYHVRQSSEIHWIYQRNLNFLGYYLNLDTPIVNELARAHVNAVVASERRIKLSDMIKNRHPASTDDIYTMLATEELYVDLYSAPIAEPESVYIFTDKTVADALVVNEEHYINPLHEPCIVSMQMGTKINWDGQPFEVINIGETEVWLRSGENSIIHLKQSDIKQLIQDKKIACVESETKRIVNNSWKDIILQASPKELESANKEFSIASQFLNEASNLHDKCKSRHVYRIIQKYRNAEIEYGNGYVGLLPRHHKKGNYSFKLPQETLLLMTEVVKNEYEIPNKRKNVRAVFGVLNKQCELKGIVAPSYKTFREFVNKRPKFEQTRKREGSRAAYKYEPCYLELEMTTPPHGDRPFEVVHLDHTLLDIELIDSDGKNMGRPWLTIMTDAYSRRFLAMYLTYDSPSIKSCMMTIRECVRRFNRFPETIIVDGGREFQSIYFETLLAWAEATKKTRPIAKSRFGCVCERLFGTTNTEFVNNLAGNTQATKRVRTVTESVNPKKHAAWTLDFLFTEICKWAYEIYDSIEHPALHKSPREACTAGMERGGERLKRLVAYDEAFLYLSMPTRKNGMSKVIVNKGVKIGYLFYWNDKFRSPVVENTRVHIRYDPYNLGIAYAYINKKWEICYSAYYVQFKDRSEREIKMIAAELRRKHLLRSRKFNITAKMLANYITSVEVTETILIQRRRDIETRKVVTVINGSAQESYAATSIPTPMPCAVTGTPSADEYSFDGIVPDMQEIYEDF